MLVLFLYGVGPFFGIPAIGATKRVIHLLDRSYSARPLAERLADVRSRQTRRLPSFASAATSSTGSRSIAIAKWSTTRRDGVPDEQHLLVVRVSGPRRRGPAHPGRARGVSGRPPLRAALQLAGAGAGGLSGGSGSNRNGSPQRYSRLKLAVRLTFVATVTARRQCASASMGSRSYPRPTSVVSPER